jgi:hypothetical protein
VISIGNAVRLWLATGVAIGLSGLLLFAQQKTKAAVTGTTVSPAPPAGPASNTEGSVRVGGQVVEYVAVAGTLTVGATDTEDAMLGFDRQAPPIQAMT